MVNTRQLFPIRGAVIAGAAGAMLTGVAAAVIAQVIPGSYIGTNFVGLTAKNVNAGLLIDQQAVVTPIGAVNPCTSSGGSATYDTCLLASPYNDTAHLRGLRTGSGWVQYLQLDVLANPYESKVDCSVVLAPNSATGGTALFEDVTATGSTNRYSTPFVLGPTQYIKCGVLNNQGTGLVLRLRGVMNDSEISS